MYRYNLLRIGGVNWVVSEPISECDFGGMPILKSLKDELSLSSMKQLDKEMMEWPLSSK